jgi:membrane protein implicated in regulation of membrane protease activity
MSVTIWDPTMDYDAATLWWIAAGITVAIELVSGTFYLLMVALGLAAAAVAAHLGAGVATQITAAALVACGAAAAGHRRRFNQPRSAAFQTNKDVNLDIGEHVSVSAWGHDRTCQVLYRGSSWTGRLSPGAEAAAGEHQISAVEGNWLILTPTTHTPH